MCVFQFLQVRVAESETTFLRLFRVWSFALVSARPRSEDVRGLRLNICVYKPGTKTNMIPHRRRTSGSALRILLLSSSCSMYRVLMNGTPSPQCAKN
eukprot:7235726-Prymnesium_polylepis.1